eukprot:6700-Heterococcus_DN1.PRE.3
METTTESTQLELQAAAADICTAAQCHKGSIKRAISFLFTLTLAAFLLHSNCKEPIGTCASRAWRH